MTKSRGDDQSDGRHDNSGRRDLAAACQVEPVLGRRDNGPAEIVAQPETQNGKGHDNRGERGPCEHPEPVVSGGMPPPKTTRLAGLEIGRTKLAALATKAQMKR